MSKDSDRYLELIKSLATLTDFELRSLCLSKESKDVIEKVLQYKKENGIVDPEEPKVVSYESIMDDLARLPEWQIRSFAINASNLEMVQRILRHKAEKGL